ncbi:hypothetical protein [Actinoplanes utahensis]|nr:hypothetical protein [Actinoplanes utahensis]GIF28460.1 hypothetical protein Aut01nite_14460 [Actinoplanes utahensis]
MTGGTLNNCIVGQATTFTDLPQSHAAVTDILNFPERAHSLTIDSGWRDVADASLTWLREHEL